MDTALLEAARKQFLAVLAQCKNTKEIAITCIGKLLRGEFNGQMQRSHLGDFIETIATFENKKSEEALFWMIPILEESALESSWKGESPIFMFLGRIKLGDKPNHSEDGPSCTKNATLLHDWYSEAIRKADPGQAEAVTMCGEDLHHGW